MEQYIDHSAILTVDAQGVPSLIVNGNEQTFHEAVVAQYLQRKEEYRQKDKKILALWERNGDIPFNADGRIQLPTH